MGDPLDTVSGSEKKKWRGASRKGIPNKATSNAREAIARFVDANSARMQEWLEQIAANDPKDAMRCLMDVMEYHVPKLARTEHTGKDGGPMIVQCSKDDEGL